MYLFPDTLILLKGGGDLGTGVAWRLHKAGFPVIITELAQPRVVRRMVAFASAVYDGEIAVEGVTAWRADSIAQARRLLDDEMIPVLIDPACETRDELKPVVMIDAIMAKRNTGTRKSDASLVIALGPGFTPNVDCHCVIETKRGHNLGRVLWSTPAEANTGVPGEIGGKRNERVLRAPVAGIVESRKRIGDSIKQGEVIAIVRGAEEAAATEGLDDMRYAICDTRYATRDTPTVRAPFDGVLRGLVHDGLLVSANMKIGDVDPRAQREHCFTLSDKALAIGGGVLEAVLEWMKMNGVKP
ncbi:MAG: EF2563 family selenium-dependent molybdenum hydroxylase system protein [Chloroflexi bacterium]|nr:EF2563 family selenium-dependent molybdenum hydroxylase system protein [Chloroflexota bacterium]